MKKITLALATVGLAAVLAGCSAGSSQVDPAAQTQPNNPPAGHGHAVQPYAGLQNRTIKALAPERVTDLLQGKGAQYALAAELNHYPGPSHALEFASQLELSADQEKAIRALNDGHKGEAKALGKQLVDLETELDLAFNAGTIAEAELTRLLTEIGMVEAKLRGIHLGTHLKTKAILTPEQVKRYDHLRGYTN